MAPAWLGQNPISNLKFEVSLEPLRISTYSNKIIQTGVL